MSLILTMELIKKHEGLQLKPYQCPAGKLTIGYGRNLEDNGISVAEAQFMLEQDVQNTEADIRRNFHWFDALSGARQAVIIDMTYNLGLPRFKGFKKMIKALSKHNYAEASRQMFDSRWAKQVGRRAVTLGKIMKSGVF